MPIIEKEDYIEPACPLSPPKPDSYRGAGLDIPAVISRLDALLYAHDESAAADFLTEQLKKARELGDWPGEISLLSEQMGLLRRSKAPAALEAVSAGLALVFEHKLERSVSGSTVLLNAATTYFAFGEPEKALPLFNSVMRSYSENLDPSDYRFAGLYNNLGLTLGALGDYERAEEYFKRAMAIIKTCPYPENELAVTQCNLARLYYARDPLDERCGACMESAWEYLNAPDLPRDGYHAFTVSKCAPDFDFFGFFIYAKKLRERMEEIYARTGSGEKHL